MHWIATFHATWTGIAVGLMVTSGGWMAQDMVRRRRRLRRAVAAHPANRPPYDWARDGRLRQAISVHRRAS